MKNKNKDFNFEDSLKTLYSQLDDWYDEMDASKCGIDAHSFIELSFKELAYLRAKGLITYEFNEYRQLSSVSLTDKGLTYFGDKRAEQIKWYFRNGFVGIVLSALTSAIISSLLK